MSDSGQKAIIYTSGQRSIYVGRLEGVLERVNVASTLLVSMDGELEYLNSSGHTLAKSRSFLIPAGAEFTINTHGHSIVQCFLNNLGTDFKSLVPQMQRALPSSGKSAVFSDLKHENDMIAEGDRLLAKRPDTDQALGQLQDWIEHWETDRPAPCDERVAMAISIIKASVTENTSVESIAQRVNLSVPRLISLFKKTTGVPIRRFRLWQRVFLTANLVAEGLTLTDAALAAGFSDYSQFSRVYRQFSGACPSAARNNTEIRGTVEH